MKLLAKIGLSRGAKVTAPESGEVEALRKDDRLHARFVVNRGGIARLKLDDGTEGMINDISYGGVAARIRSPSLPQLPPLVNAKLCILDQSIDVSLKTIRIVRQQPETIFVGFAFQHDSSETLIFLRNILEPLRLGSTLALLPQSLRKERYQGPEWTAMRGDGPIDLLIKSDPSTGALQEALLTFRRRDHYLDLSFKNGQLHTSESIDGAGDNHATTGPSRMVRAPELAHATVREALLILASAPAAQRAAVEPLMQLAFASLNLTALKDAS